MAVSDILSNTQRTSVFVNGYIPTSKASTYEDDYRQKTYLQVNSATFTSLIGKGGLTAADIQSLCSDDFWELIVTDYSEAHSEKVARHNTLSESFCWFALGPMPVQVSLTAKLLTAGDKDYRTKFLYAYTSNMRAKQLSKAERTLTLVVKDTCMKLFVQSLNFNESSAEPDFSTFTLTGIGYKYQNIYSEDATLYTGYYGKTPSVSTRKFDLGLGENSAKKDGQQAEPAVVPTNNTGATK